MAQIPPPTDALWNRLVSGTTTHKFALFAANMALARAVRLTATDPGRKPAMIADLHQFCSKFADALAPELQALR
jgi:hypothetical protein